MKYSPIALLFTTDQTFKKTLNSLKKIGKLDE